ncbi:hypothetical protein CLV40_12055 [Actinokineospora auranticolor]|uniref:Uncharacterized protein n=1 Tax=Actinokineospora auranticolor TaxID=155976 RepID=A0A2S6GGJ5_9PSEU|nr:hypothetical protein CLV40_12055 [Actinokineospora auranticolor]
MPARPPPAQAAHALPTQAVSQLSPARHTEPAGPLGGTFLDRELSTSAASIHRISRSLSRCPGADRLEQGCPPGGGRGLSWVRAGLSNKESDPQAPAKPDTLTQARPPLSPPRQAEPVACRCVLARPPPAQATHSLPTQVTSQLCPPRQAELAACRCVLARPPPAKPHTPSQPRLPRNCPHPVRPSPLPADVCQPGPTRPSRARPAHPGHLATVSTPSGRARFPPMCASPAPPAQAALAHPAQAASQPFPAPPNRARPHPPEPYSPTQAKSPRNLSPPRQAEPTARRRVPARPRRTFRAPAVCSMGWNVFVWGDGPVKLSRGWGGLAPPHRSSPPQVRRGPAQRRFTPSSTARFSRSDHGRTGPRWGDRYPPHHPGQTSAGPGSSVQPHAKNKGGLDRANLLCAGPLRARGGAKAAGMASHPTRREAWQARPPTQSKSTQSRRVAGARRVRRGLGSCGGCVDGSGEKSGRRLVRGGESWGGVLVGVLRVREGGGWGVRGEEGKRWARCRSGGCGCCVCGAGILAAACGAAGDSAWKAVGSGGWVVGAARCLGGSWGQSRVTSKRTGAEPFGRCRSASGMPRSKRSESSSSRG